MKRYSLVCYRLVELCYGTMVISVKKQDMVDEHDQDERLLDEDDQEIGANIAGDAEAFLSFLPHYYRDEVSQTTSAQDRIDQTTNWAITVLIAILSVVFSSPDMPAYLLLIGIIALCVFLPYEVRRYRFFDLYRSRVDFLGKHFCECIRAGRRRTR